MLSPKIAPLMRMASDVRHGDTHVITIRDISPTIRMLLRDATAVSISEGAVRVDSEQR